MMMMMRNEAKGGRIIATSRAVRWACSCVMVRWACSCVMVRCATSCWKMIAWNVHCITSAASLLLRACRHLTDLAQWHLLWKLYRFTFRLSMSKILQLCCSVAVLRKSQAWRYQLHIECKRHRFSTHSCTENALSLRNAIAMQIAKYRCPAFRVQSVILEDDDGV